MGDETLADVGEFEVIARVIARLRARDDAVVGPGDDAAVISAPDGRVVVTTDVLVEGRHFRLDWSSPYDVGRKAAAQNLADVIAMGAAPTALLVGLAAPADTRVDMAEAIADGLRDEAALVGASVVGGDTVSSDSIVISVTALGDLQGHEPLLRSGAHAGEELVLVGRLGHAQAGLEILRGGDADALARHVELADAHRVPSVAYGAALALRQAGATSLIDVSDGLLADAGHVAAASGVALVIDAALLDTMGLDAAANDLGADALSWVLTGGDDHAFLATLPRGAAAGLEECRVIGEVTAGRGVQLTGASDVAGTGWQHFTGES